MYTKTRDFILFFREINFMIFSYSNYCCERDNPMDTSGLCVKCDTYTILTCGSGTTGSDSEEMLPKNDDSTEDEVQNPSETLLPPEAGSDDENTQHSGY